MSLGKLLADQLRHFGADPLPLDPDSGADHHVRASAHGQSGAQVAFYDGDRYSISMRALSVGRLVEPASNQRARLNTAADAIVRRLAFLEEPLAIWEVEGSEQLAQLRSNPPLRDGAELFYWEVELSTEDQLRATLGRFRWAPGMVEREGVPYPATFAMVARIADALEAALAESV
ncbi:MAG TPA: hypothetical protein VFS21_30880 [Roseiflexaceae bacterium]|nr:hypothetical protein [Roseiflexaceae bacterium]